MKMNKRGFTLVEIMIVVGTIGLLAAMALPNFIRSRQTAQANACINNMRQIESAKEQWALENNQNVGDVITEAEAGDYIGGGYPSCPGSGTYTIGVIGTKVTCSLSAQGHVLD